MKNEFRVLTGTAKEVETQLNELEKKHWVIIYGISTTNEQTTIVVGISGK